MSAARSALERSSDTRHVLDYVELAVDNLDRAIAFFGKGAGRTKFGNARGNAPAA